MRAIVVAGASLAGLSAADALRRRGFAGAITVVGEEPHPPYQRPPLSKQFLSGAFDRPRLDLRAAHRLQVDWRLGVSAHALDLARREVELSDGDRLRFDGLVIATGARARRPGWWAPLEGVFTLRTVDDALALRAYIARPTRKVAIVGAGFIGSEVAATLRALGCDVTLIDVDAVPMQRVLGDEIGRVCLALHEAHGVRPLFGVEVRGLIGTRAVDGVQLKDGRVVAADCVVVGVGATPNVEWLEGSGLVLENGVVCDATCAAIGAEAVVAAGDVTRWEHPHYGPIRVEHWDNAIAQGDAAAQTLLAERREAPPYAGIPSFWSDQYDCKLQLVGVPRASDELRIVEGTIDAQRMAALYEREGRVVAAFLRNSAHRVAAYRRMVEAGVANLAQRAAA